jgi:hypothetical protein
MYYKLSEAMQMLPFSSPRLHTLQLKLCLNYDDDFHVFPEYADSSLVGTINLLRLPDLRSLNLAITCYRYDGYCYHSEVHPADVSHFLVAHPLIVDLSFDGCGLAPIAKTTAQSLKTLRSFTGSFEHCTILSAENLNIQRVALKFKREVDCDQKGQIEATPPIPLRSVTRMTIRAVDECENVLKYPHELTPQFYWRLASFFPNITHLDIVLGQRVANSFVSLPVVLELTRCRNTFKKPLCLYENSSTSACKNTGSILFGRRHLGGRNALPLATRCS